MAVSLFNAGAPATADSVLTIDVTCNCGGSNPAVLVLAQFKPTAPSSVTAIWDQGGTNQAMITIRSWSDNNGTTFALFGIVGPTTGTSKTARLSWTTPITNIIAQASAWQGVKQTSVATAFINFAETSVMSAPQMPVIGASGDVGVVQFGCEDNTALTAVNENTLYTPTNWNSGTFRAAANYVVNTGGGFSNLDAVLAFSAFTSMQGINIVQATTAASGSARLSAAGALAANAIVAKPASALLAGAGGLAANATTISASAASALLAAAGTLAANANVISTGTASASLAGAGGLAALATQQNVGSSSLVVAGGLTATTISRSSAPALLAAAGGLAVTTTQRMLTNARLDGSVSLSVADQTAVSLFDTGGTGTIAGSLLDVSCNCGGSNRAILLLAQFTGGVGAPTSLGVTWDQGFTNQAMTQVRSWNNGAPTPTYFYMFGITAPTTGFRTARVTWSGFQVAIAQVSCWNGVNQTSVAAAFINGNEALSNSAAPQVTVASASGSVAVAHFMSPLTGNFNVLNDTTLYALTDWNSSSFTSGANYANGAASVVLDGAMSSPTFWYAQGISIVNLPTAGNVKASLAAAGGLIAGFAPAAASASLAAAGGLTANAAISTLAAGISATLAAAGGLAAIAAQRTLVRATLGSIGQLSAAATASSDANTAAWKLAVQGILGTVSPAREAIVNELILGLKADGVWAKLDRLWLLAAENPASALVDIRAAQLATAVNAPTFTPNAGYQKLSNVSSYLDSNLANNFGTGNYQQDSACYFAWNNTLDYDLGALVGTGGSARTAVFLPEYYDGNFYGTLNGSFFWDIITSNPTAAIGLYLLNRTPSSTVTVDLNGTQFGSNSSAPSQPLTTDNFTALVGSGGSSWTNRQCGCWGFGGALSPSERVALNIRLSTYMADITPGIVTTSALLEGSGSLYAVGSGATRAQASALLAAAVSLNAYADVNNVIKAASAQLSGSGGLSALANKRSIIQGGAFLRAAGALAMLDSSLEKSPVPSVRHSDPTYEGDNADVMVMITSHLNDGHVLEIGGSGVLAGRGLPGYGPMQAVTLQPPLIMGTDGRISIDIAALKTLLGI